MTATTEIQRQIEAGSRGGVDMLIERLAAVVGGRADARVVYGEPVQRDDVTVIPVAKVRWGFGGGGGTSEQAEGGSGSGGGGGLSATPLGYIEIREGSAEYKAIRDAGAFLPMLPLVILAGGLSATLVLRGLRRLARG